MQLGAPGEAEAEEGVEFGVKTVPARNKARRS